MSGFERRSWARCSVKFLIAALDALYAGFPAPGGLVIPCFEPVMTMDLVVRGWDARSSGSKNSSPFKGPKTLVSSV